MLSTYNNGERGRVCYKLLTHNHGLHCHFSKWIFRVMKVGQEARGGLTAASPLQLHFLHVDLTGRHPDGNWVNDGRVLEGRQTKRQET